jgi:hypothetical protein
VTGSSADCTSRIVAAAPGNAASTRRWEGKIVASVYVETITEVAVERVWEAIANVGAAHRRLLPGRVADARIEVDTRSLTIPDGSQNRELILAVDHPSRRMTYMVIEGQRLPVTYHHASFQ